MNPILLLGLVIILSAALPWWPYSAYGRLRHHRPWDWLLDTPSSEDKLSFWRHYDQQREALGRSPPETSQKEAMKLRDGNSETDPTFATLQRQERWVEPEERWVA
jgi:hypothetical protein